MPNWKDIHPDFTEELRRNWEFWEFTYEETEKWVKEVGLGIGEMEAYFASWLRDDKKVNIDWVLNYEDKKELRKEFREWRTNNKSSTKLNSETVEKLREITNDYSQGFYDKLSFEQKLLVGELIPDYFLKFRYKKLGLCQECGQPNTGNKWCKSCNAKHFQQDFDKWTSEDQEIDKLIQKWQLRAIGGNRTLEWIPYEEFTEIEYLAEGGFGKVYKAKWNKGSIDHWNTKENSWERIKENKEVALKILKNSQNATTEFLQEIINHKLIDGGAVADCYGISQAPITKDYVMVNQYVESGNLRQYINNNQPAFIIKLSLLYQIATGLKNIHHNELVHGDFHPGNILLSKRLNRFQITDLGLSKPANEKGNENVYGVLPYVAPEVLKGKKYTQASDTYSFGIVVYEAMSELSPYYNIPHDGFLAVKICQGLRPNLDENRLPQPLKDLIKHCLDSEPMNRPTASELHKILESWVGWNFETSSWGEIWDQNSELYKQYMKTELEEFNAFKSWLKADKDREESLEEWDSILSQTEKDVINNNVKSNRWFRNYKVQDDKYQEIIKKWKKSRNNYQTHLQVIYTSHLLKFKNLPEPQNSQEINEQFWNSKQYNITEQANFDMSGLVEDLEEKTEQLTIDNWTALHPNFTSEQIQSWANHSFSPSQTTDWLSIGLQPTDHTFATYLRDTKHLTPETALNQADYNQLKEEFQAYQTEQEQPPK